MVGMGSGGWKRVALGAIKRFVQKKNFWFVKIGNICGQREKACANEGLLYVEGQLLRAVRKLSE